MGSCRLRISRSLRRSCCWIFEWMWLGMGGVGKRRALFGVYDLPPLDVAESLETDNPFSLGCPIVGD